MLEQHNSDIACPYCQEEFMDSFLFDASETLECDQCGMKFELQITTDIVYHTYASCELNGVDHDWLIESDDLDYDYFKCAVCSKRKTEKVDV